MNAQTEIRKRKVNSNIRPFSCGSCFGDWVFNNCDSCMKTKKKIFCELEKELWLAYYGSGEIPEHIAKRLGVKQETHKWFCREKKVIIVEAKE